MRGNNDNEISMREESIKMIVVCAVFLLLGGVYLFNATSLAGKDIPTDLLVAAASLIVGYYFRGKR
jgi:hypothetical protein